MSLRVGLLGLGTVGGGTVRVLRENAALISQRAGRPIEVVRALVRDPGRSRDTAAEGVELTTDPAALVGADDIDVIAELMGGTGLATELVCNALAAGQPVVTANKAMIAECGERVFAAARESGQPIAFEAAVAGGIPIIKALREGLSGNRVRDIAGIINGTTNFILSRMESDRAEFADALAEAQAKGYAEADPTFDIEGIDAAHKLAILATLGLDMPLAFERVRTRGIAEVSAADIRYAQEFGYRIKHLAVARRGAAGVELRVEPTLVPLDSFIAKIDGVMNGIFISANAVGQAGFYGPGAGALATASSVVGDLVEIAQGRTLPPPAADADVQFVPEEAVETAFYLRMQALDKPGVMREISAVLAGQDISIEAIVQKETDTHDDRATVVLLTHEIDTGALRDAVSALEALDVIVGRIKTLRLEHLD